MKDKQYIRSLIDYNAWANTVCYDTCRGLDPEELTRPRPSVFTSILLGLNHLYVVDQIWLAHMTGRSHEFEALRSTVFEEFEPMWNARQEMDQTLKDYVDGLSGDALEEVVEYELIGGNKGALSRAMILTHLALHGNFHRGWITDQVGQVPHPPVPMDLPVFERALREQGLPPLN
jgi:uncharacterized damage-inducible protein DinB